MGREPHVLVLPLPVQGHINPMLQFSKHLASKGVKVTFITTTSVRKTIHLQAPSSVAIECISDGSDDGKQAESLEAYFRRFRDVVSQTLAEFIVQKQKADDLPPPKLLVYDSVLPWALDVAKGLGLGGASFFTQSCAVNAIYYHLNRGHFEVPLGGPTMLSLPEMPLLGIDDLPSSICDVGAYPALLTLMADKFSNFRDANWLLFNTFDKLEEQIMKWMMASEWPIKTVGPSIPSMGYDDQDYGLSLFSPSFDAACINWLDSKPTASVVYASFGSLARLSEAQMEELAWGLYNATAHFHFHFLWVVRASEEAKLPANFVDETSEIGLIVNWSPQLQVLAHPAVGCFMTHCGWNSTLEALALGVPIVAMPQWSDQATNAKYIADVWRVGLRLGADDKGVITRQEIGVRIKEVMEGEGGMELRKHAMRWRELAREAVQEEGSSDNNIEEFVSELMCH